MWKRVRTRHSWHDAALCSKSNVPCTAAALLLVDELLSKKFSSVFSGEFPLSDSCYPLLQQRWQQPFRSRIKLGITSSCQCSKLTPGNANRDQQSNVGFIFERVSCSGRQQVHDLLRWPQPIITSTIHNTPSNMRSVFILLLQSMSLQLKLKRKAGGDWFWRQQVRDQVNAIKELYFWHHWIYIPFWSPALSV